MIKMMIIAVALMIPHNKMIMVTMIMRRVYLAQMITVRVLIKNQEVLTLTRICKVKEQELNIIKEAAV